MSEPSNPFNDYVFVNATPAERGSFSLAMEKALEKLEKFQLPDASFFILQWVQALVASGAKQVNISYDTQRLSSQFSMEISFDGPGYTAKEIMNMYDHVFLSGRDRSVDRLRELALGWLSACSLNPSRVALQSNGWFRLRDKSTGKKETCSQVPTKDAEGNELEQDGFHRLDISGRGSFKFHELLQTRCGDVPILLNFNGEAISIGSGSTGVPWPNRSFTSGPTKGVMGATYGGAASSQVAFIRHGVNFVSRREPALEPSVIVRVSDPTLSKNVSQTDVVRDDAYDDFLERIRREMKSMALGLTTRRIPAYQRDSLNKYIQAYLGSHLDVRALDDPMRLKLLGPGYESLLKFPVFVRAGGKYISVHDIYAVYKQMGCLLFCTDPQARTARWGGLLLVIDPGEVLILKKFCPNLVHLSLEEVRRRSKASVGGVSRQEARPKALASRVVDVGDRTYTVSVQDRYPTGQAILRADNSHQQTPLPGVEATLCVGYVGETPNDTQVMQLAKELPSILLGILAEICAEIKSTDSFSRLRYAELACEIICLQLENEPFANQPPLEAIRDMGGAVRLTELLGLEDGRMVSIADLAAFLEVIPTAYLGGVFVDGLESGALDPMPCADRLLRKVFAPHQLTETSRLGGVQNQELKSGLRRQTVMRGLGVHPDPAQAIKQYATEAAAQAAELARMEAEYRAAMEGPELFVKPDEDRLADLADEGDDFEGFDLTEESGSEIVEAVPVNPAQAPTQPLGPPPLPSLDSDLASCREADPDFLPPGPSIHVERRETSFTLHLATRRRLDQQGRVLLLRAGQTQTYPHTLPIDGFIRVCPTSEHTVEQLVSEALEQLVVKVVHAFRGGPQSSQMRKQLRSWLHLVGCLEPRRLQEAQGRRNWLFDLALVPCLGNKFLSWRTLHEQYQRDDHLLVSEQDHPPFASREVLKVDSTVSREVLGELGFKNVKRWSPADETLRDFEALYRSTRRDLSSILAGTDTPLLRPGVIAKLAEDASLWRRWRSGFLSWDAEQSVAVLNPKHRVGKKLVKQFANEPAWSAIFASALFSTINRGLEEVEDHHERAFLEALLESLD